MSAILRFFRDLAHVHVGQHGLHRWTKWREREWCEYCGRDAR
jgi:hypothetical protein